MHDVQSSCVSDGYFFVDVIASCPVKEKEINQ